jgi:DNA-binding transcriptional regulator GbsR (MarR family)
MPTVLSPQVSAFVLHWGEMGSRWGINRTVAQVHALLYLSPRPITAEDIVEALQVARSNVSTSLKELMGWGIVRRVHVAGDRRDHFETMTDVWAMFRIILDERKKRELDPTVAAVRTCLEDARAAGPSEQVTVERLEALAEFFAVMEGGYQSLRALPPAVLVQTLKLGGAVGKVLNP